MKTLITSVRLSLIAAALLVSAGLSAEPIGEVDTTFKLIGSNHKIVVEAFDDPKIEGVTCYVSSAKTGGVSGMLGLAQDTSDASIACRQVGTIRARSSIGAQEEVFSQRRSVLFKRLRVVRMFDAQRQVLLYLTYSDKLIEGSPKNSLTAVALNGAVLTIQ